MTTLKIASEDKHLVYGEVYVPSIIDSDGDYMDAEDIEKAAHGFLRDLNLQKIDLQHSNKLVPGATVVESFIARKGDPDFIEGSWVVGVHIPDADTWSKIKKGEINGFSLEALVKGEETEIEVEVPPVISGKTTKSEDDHDHDFYVTYDPEGNLVGGRTSEVNGHYHLIKRGTITEEAAGHRHRFSFVEQLK